MYFWGFSGENENHRVITDELAVATAGAVTVDEFIDGVGVTRPNGTSDYQIILIKEGCGRFNFDGKIKKIYANTVLLFHPGEPQIYKYYPEDHPMVAWLHFGGTRVPEILENLKLTEQRQIKISDSNELWKIINKIIVELLHPRIGSGELNSSYILQVLTLISRNDAVRPKSKQEQTIEYICEKITSEYFKNYSNEYYADKCNMSVSHFLALFKKYTGTTPLNYKLVKRMSIAKSLLDETDYKISDISKITGFEDPLYFCKYFKKSFGVSPSEYRESCKSKQND